MFTVSWNIHLLTTYITLEGLIQTLFNDIGDISKSFNSYKMGLLKCDPFED